MQIWEIVATAIALSMDAFAVAVCKGLATDKVKLRHMLIVGAWFGGFQGLMPLLGYLPVRLLGPVIEKYVTAIDHWVAFVLLAFIGGKMIVEAMGRDEECTDCSLSFSVMLAMAVATSIDALAVGITIGLQSANILLAVLLIGVITFVLSAIGVKLGNVFGAKYKFVAELLGGITLVLIGTKTLLEHLGILNF